MAPRRRSERDEIEAVRQRLARNRQLASLERHVTKYRFEEGPDGVLRAIPEPPTYRSLFEQERYAREQMLAQIYSLAEISVARDTPLILTEEAIESARSRGDARDLKTLIAAGVTLDGRAASAIGALIFALQNERDDLNGSRAARARAKRLLDMISAGYRLVGRGRTQGGGLQLSPSDVKLYDALLIACRAAKKGESTNKALPRRLSIKAYQALEAYRRSPKITPRRAALEILAVMKRATPS